MVFFIDSYQVVTIPRLRVHLSGIVYNRVGLIGRVIQGESRMLFFMGGCYRWEVDHG
jgi:hypothetical protein